mmetsp:Transcript_3352/g.10767  ORF Transcript_3352/g.10767 Transcript_3352/m.10767 type:complete len:227 (+) Transcript_3352:393-1073(+)
MRATCTPGAYSSAFRCSTRAGGASASLGRTRGPRPAGSTGLYAAAPTCSGPPVAEPATSRGSPRDWPTCSSPAGGAMIARFRWTRSLYFPGTWQTHSWARSLGSATLCQRPRKVTAARGVVTVGSASSWPEEALRASIWTSTTPSFVLKAPPTPMLQLRGTAGTRSCNSTGGSVLRLLGLLTRCSPWGTLLCSEPHWSQSMQARGGDWHAPPASRAGCACKSTPCC